MSNPIRFTLTVELSPAEGDNAQQTVEWIQKNFDYYHPRLHAKVSSKVAIHAAEPAPPKIDHSLL